MPLDAICLAAAVRELEAGLIGARVDKIRQPERDELIFALRGERNLRLLISAGAADARMHFTDAEYENPASPPMFCMLLRKHLSGARITSVEQPPAERVVILSFAGTDQLGEAAGRRLAVELMGRNSNIILIDGEDIIIDCLRRVDTGMSETRPVLPGLIYRLPPAQGKQSPLELTFRQWEEAVRTAPRDMPVERWLNGTFSALSPLICREIVYRACGDASATVAEAEDALAQCAYELISAPPVPYLLSEPDGGARDFSYTAVTQYGERLSLTRAESFSGLLESFYTKRSNEERRRARASNLTRTVKNARDRALRRVAAQREELKRAGDRERFRECGDLIMANLHDMKRGDRILRAQDFYAGEGEYRDIPLDIRKNPQQNAAKYYKDYAKAKNAEQVLGAQIERGALEARYLDSVLMLLSLAPGERELEDIRAELAGAGYVKDKNAGGQASKKKQKPLPPRKFMTPGGLEILVGRSNTQNDELTFKTAFRTDIWLHIKDLHGSHCILRTGGETPSDADIAEAAAFAAFYSEAREEKRALVDYCLVRYVKKQPGGRPGMVLYTDYKTVAVTPRDGDSG